MIATVVERIKDGASAAECIGLMRERYRRGDGSLRDEDVNLASLSTQMCHIRKAAWADGLAIPEGFSLTSEETHALKRQRVEAKIARQDHTLVIPDAARLLESATHLLETATHATSMSRLILALALVSGRRITELTNGRSTFIPVIGRPHHTVFHGQLKLKQRDAAPYTIPLLVSHTLFDHAMRILREKQGDVSTLTNEQCKDRYDGNANAALHRGELVGMPTRGHVHSLRGVYVKLVALLWESPWEPNRLGMLILGHAALEESIAYVGSISVRGGDALRGTWGRLELLDVTEE